MDAQKLKKLEEKGWKSTSVEKLFGLSEEEVRLIDVKIGLGRALKNYRKKIGLTQSEVARMVRSSQSRVAKMEAGDSKVTIDLILKSLYTLDAPDEIISNTFSKHH